MSGPNLVHSSLDYSNYKITIVSDCLISFVNKDGRKSENYKVSESAFYLQSVPGVGGDKKEDEGLTREELQEQERLR